MEAHFANWAGGAALFFSPLVLFNLVLGTFIGLFFGVVPGLTATLALVLLLPLTYGIAPEAGVALLMSAYVGGITGGLVTAVMLGIPGTPASVTTVFDGHPMAKRGEAGQALGWGVVASFFGGVISWIALAFLTPQLANIALGFNSFDYAAVILFGFVVVGSISSETPLRGLLMIALGVLLGTVGLDPLHGVERLTFDIRLLETGIGLVPLLVGAFIISQAFLEAERMRIAYIVPKGRLTKLVPPLEAMWARKWNFLRSSLIGTAIGILPGIGAVLANFVAYGRAKKASRAPESFGKGNPDGIIAGEAANNATVGSALVPMLALGIPGDIPVVILMSGLMLHGIRPGPLFLQTYPDISFFIFITYLAANVVMLVFMLTIGLRLFARFMVVDKAYLLPIIVIFGLMGSYNVSNSLTDVLVSVVSGFVAYVLIKARYPLTPLIIGLILGPALESHLRIALTTSRGSLLPFLQGPVSLSLLIGTAAMLAAMVWARRNVRRPLSKEGSL